MSTKKKPASHIKADAGFEPVFTKRQILSSVKYANRRDLLTALLEEDNTYTFAQVDELMSGYLNRNVK